MYITLSLILIVLTLFYIVLSYNKFKIRPYDKIIQTIKDKSTIPSYIHEAFEQYGKGVTRTVYDDDECRAFFNKYFGKVYLEKFDYMVNGCHKADFFRYAYLYIHGGIYLDIKCIPLKDLKEIFYNNNVTFFVESFNGIMATPPKNRLMLDCLNNLLLYDNKEKREVPCQNFENIIKQNTLNNQYNHALNKTVRDIPDIYNYKIHTPMCKKTDRDRWGFCKQFIKNDSNENVIQLRDLKYVPNYNTKKQKNVYKFDNENKMWKIE